MPAAENVCQVVPLVGGGTHPTGRFGRATHVEFGHDPEDERLAQLRGVGDVGVGVNEAGQQGASGAVQDRWPGWDLQVVPTAAVTGPSMRTSCAGSSRLPSKTGGLSDEAG